MSRALAKMSLKSRACVLLLRIDVVSVPVQTLFSLALDDRKVGSDKNMYVNDSLYSTFLAYITKELHTI